MLPCAGMASHVICMLPDYRRGWGKALAFGCTSNLLYLGATVLLVVRLCKACLDPYKLKC